MDRAVTNVGGEGTRLDVDSGEVPVFCGGVVGASGAVGETEDTEMPVGRVGGGGGADGGDDLGEGVGAGRVPEGDGASREVNVVSKVVPDISNPVNIPL